MKIKDKPFSSVYLKIRKAKKEEEKRKVQGNKDEEGNKKVIFLYVYSIICFILMYTFYLSIETEGEGRMFHFLPNMDYPSNNVSQFFFTYFFCTIKTNWT